MKVIILAAFGGMTGERENLKPRRQLRGLCYMGVRDRVRVEKRVWVEVLGGWDPEDLEIDEGQRTNRKAEGLLGSWRSSE